MRPIRIGVGATFPVANPQAYTDALAQLQALSNATKMNTTDVTLAIQTLDADVGQFETSDQAAFTSSGDYKALLDQVTSLNVVKSSDTIASILAEVEQRAKIVKDILISTVAKAATPTPTVSTQQPVQTSIFTPGRIAGALIGGILGKLIGGNTGAVVGAIAGIVVDGSVTGKTA